MDRRRRPPNSINFAAWQEGQNRLLLQLKAKRKSMAQSGQRIPANPCLKSPQLKFPGNTSRITGRKKPCFLSKVSS